VLTRGQVVKEGRVPFGYGFNDAHTASQAFMSRYLGFHPLDDTICELDLGFGGLERGGISMNNIRSKKDEVKIQTSCEKTKKPW
jgi:hypothetical protein